MWSEDYECEYCSLTCVKDLVDRCTVCYTIGDTQCVWSPYFVGEMVG